MNRVSSAITFCFFACALSLSSCASAPSAARSAPENAADTSGPWVVTWGAAQQETEAGNMPKLDLGGSTLRQRVRVSIGGKSIRVKFSNVFGDGPLVVKAAAIAPSGGGSAIEVSGAKPLTFGGGKPFVQIAAGKEAYSDPVDFTLAPLAEITVSAYLTDVPAKVTGHPGSRATSFIRTYNLVSSEDLPVLGENVAHWYFLADVEVAAKDAYAVAILGDSITDGRGSTTDENNRWPDVLAARLQANPATAHVGVLNSGIGGNTVLYGGLGPSAVSRVNRDVFAQKGVRWMIFFEGVNDIGGIRDSGTQETRTRQLIAAYEKLIADAHERKVLVYGCTITPFKGSGYYREESEAARKSVNDWIRTSGKFDAVIDMDALTRDSGDPERLRKVYDSGDGLHLNPDGYRAMGEAVDLGLFR